MRCPRCGGPLDLDWGPGGEEIWCPCGFSVWVDELERAQRRLIEKLRGER